MSKISTETAKIKYGIKNSHEIMSNGELRFRLLSDDGSSYIKTISGSKGAWQNSHYHKITKEIYIIQQGWMVLASLINNDILIKIYYPNDIISTEPNIVHNVYLSKNTITHTIKYGIPNKNDWFPDKEFTVRTKKLSEKDILKLAN